MKLFISFSILGFAFGGTSFSNLERHASCDSGVPRFPILDPYRGGSDQPLKREYIVPSESDGDLYSNSLDMLALSQYIYQLAELRKHARDNQDTELTNSLNVSTKRPVCLEKLSKLVRDNLHHIQETASEATSALDSYLSDEDHKEYSDHTKQDRNLYVFADGDEDTKESRVHGIAVNDEKKRVEVVFRGTANVSLKNAWYDWSTNLNAFWKRKEKNPIEEHREDTPVIKMHRGFARVLLGKPNSQEKPIQKILSDVKPLMKPGYRLYVSGHSLGGAIATLFGFYAASDPSLTKDGPVTVYSYAAPRVGGAYFREAFEHLERRGKIRHGRFHNKKDKVPQLPLHAGSYQHVGMEVRLRKEEPPVVDYPVDKNWRQKGQGIVDTVTSLPEALKYHSCDEMLKRLKRAKNAFLSSTLEHEYRSVWGIQG